MPSEILGILTQKGTALFELCRMQAKQTCNFKINAQNAPPSPQNGPGCDGKSTAMKLHASQVGSDHPKAGKAVTILVTTLSDHYLTISIAIKETK